MSLRSKILEVRDLKERTVTVPEWGDATLVVRGMTGAQYDRFITAHTASPVKAMAEALIGCVIDPETGKPVFEPADRDTLMSKNGSVLVSLTKVLTEVSGVGIAAWADAEKNLPLAGDDSISISPNNSTPQ
jgi:hypothetical protein